MFIYVKKEFYYFLAYLILVVQMDGRTWQTRWWTYEYCSSPDTRTTTYASICTLRSWRLYTKWKFYCLLNIANFIVVSKSRENDKRLYLRSREVNMFPLTYHTSSGIMESGCEPKPKCRWNRSEPGSLAESILTIVCISSEWLSYKRTRTVREMEVHLIIPCTFFGRLSNGRIKRIKKKSTSFHNLCFP